MLNNKFLYLNFLALFLGINLSGCGDIVGPSGLPKTRMSYNSSLQSSDNEQFLINIVRLRYGEGAYFLGINSITSQNNLLTSSGGLFSYANGSSAFGDLAQITPSVTYEQKPTITYTPLQGSEFMNKMLNQVPLEKAVLLIKSGWSPSLVMRILIQSIGPLDNATSASRYVSSYAPEYQQFVNLSYLINKLDREQKLEIALTKYNDRPAILFQISDTQAQQDIAHLLKLNKPYKQIILTDGCLNTDILNSNVIPVHTRSFMGVLYYLSKGVEVNQDKEAIKNGSIPQTVAENGAIFDWTKVTQNIMAVNISESSPENTSTKVFYQNKWFYIANNDQDSKKSLILLGIIFSLQSGDIKGIVPIVTIPT